MNYSTFRKTAKTGDLILVEGTGLPADIIRACTHSKFSHIGMAVRATMGAVPRMPAEHDAVLFLESSKAPSARDVMTGKIVRGVRLVAMSEMLRYEWDRGAKIGVRSLNKPFGLPEFQVFDERRHQVMGTPYEKNLMELWKAAWDGWLGQNKTALRWLFCSELVAQILIWLNIMAPDRPSNEYTPDDFATRDLFRLPILPPWSYGPVRRLLKP